MEILEGQIDVFNFLGDIKKEIVQEEKKVIRKKKVLRVLKLLKI
ncbi:hypothetical protein [Clostridium perfringens]|nr:hypothetical protein [Clostridium perfringens]